MKTYTEILQDLKDNDISFNRWYTIDNLFYIHFTSIDNNNYIDSNRELRAKINRIFVSPDIFISYNCVCIDMNKQVGTKNTYDPKNIISYDRNRRERISKAAIHFEL